MLKNVNDSYPNQTQSRRLSPPLIIFSEIILRRPSCNAVENVHIKWAVSMRDLKIMSLKLFPGYKLCSNIHTTSSSPFTPLNYFQ